jgi:hypothetical protein
MTYFEDEVPKELIVGGEYTGREFKIFMSEHQNIRIISKSCKEFTEWMTEKLQVLEIIEGFIHYNDTNSYYVPNHVSKIYIVE